MEAFNTSPRIAVMMLATSKIWRGRKKLPPIGSDTSSFRAYMDGLTKRSR